jgi:hypothetical protein
VSDAWETWTTVVRLFPDHASSPMWFPDPVDYADARLSADLERDLRAWEDSYYASLGPDHDWISAGARRAFEEAGDPLAQRLADELGSGFVVECHQRRYSNAGSTLNVAAAQAFSAIAAESRARWESLERLRGEGGSFGWFASGPRNSD